MGILAHAASRQCLGTSETHYAAGARTSGNSVGSSGATLVEEERIVPLVKGENQVDFSWANTQIDPGTIVFRVVAPVGDKPLDGESAVGQLSAQ